MMRWGRVVAVAVTVVALAACGGGGKKSNTAATGSGSNGPQVSAGSDSGSAPSASSGEGQSAANDSPVVGADGASTDAGGGQPQAAGTDAPVPPGVKPFAGNYNYHSTGTMGLNGSNSNVDQQDTTTVEDLSDSDQRVTMPGAGGSQITTLRFSSDKIELLSLKMKGALNKTFNGPVLYSPVPFAVGQAWEWTLTSTDNLTHVTQKSKIDREENVTVGGQTVETYVLETDLTISGDVNGSGHLTSFVSPSYKLPVRNHSTLDATYTTFHVVSDITSDLLDLRPS